MNTKIPPAVGAVESFGAFPTRNTKEAALLYALAEVNPVLSKDGNLMAQKIMQNGKPVCFFFFNHSPVAAQIHQAFGHPTEAKAAGGTIPDEYVPVMLSIIIQMWENWERLKEATQGIPLHRLSRSGNKVFIKPDTEKKP